MKMFRALVLMCALATPAIAAPRNEGLAGFGSALAINGADLFVGESQNETRPGTVYVYRKVANKWTEHARITASDGIPGDGFGTAIIVAGDYMLVTATLADKAKGAGYVFKRDATGAWKQTAKLSADNGPGEFFGYVAAFNGDVALFGTSGQNKFTGAAYVFRRSGEVWTLEATLRSPEPAEQRYFGSGVGIAGNRLLIAETRYNEGRGTIRVFAREGTDWKHLTNFSANGLVANDRFGAPMTVVNDRIYAAASGFSGGTGAVVEFKPQTEGQWIESGRYHAYDGRPADGFGLALAVEGNNVWVGAPRANGMRGAVYHMWRSTADTLAGGAERMSPGPLNAQTFFGNSIAAKGNLAAATLANADYGLGAVAVWEYAAGKWSMSTILRSAEDRIASVTGKKVDCINGKAAGFECSGVQLVSYLSASDMGGARGVQINDVWGWTDPQTGKEWALVGRMDGVSFVDISNPEKPVYLADLPMTPGSNPAIWRTVRVYKDHAYVVADGSGPHGMQVFDLKKLRSIKTPTRVEADLVYRKVNSSHNVVINEETGFAYIVGAGGGGETCGGGLHMVDIREPKNPQFLGCFADPQTGRASTGYSHDAQCVVYRGPDNRYTGKEICIGSNETMLSIADVTDKKKPVAISRVGYPNVGYTHQGWFDEQQKYFYVNDEIDEISGQVQNTRTIVWDLSKLDDPQVATMFMSPTNATDHNLYIKGDTMYQSHYAAGVRFVDISNRTAPVEIGFFDTVPYGANTPGYNAGSWSNYPFFKSGVIVATSLNEGLFILKKMSNKPVL